MAHQESATTPEILSLIVYDWVRASNVEPPVWQNAKGESRCVHCRNRLKMGHTHNCRLCGYVFCSMCTGKYSVPTEYRKKGKKGLTRVCFGCRDLCLCKRNESKPNQQLRVRPSRRETRDERISPSAADGGGTTSLWTASDSASNSRASTPDPSVSSKKSSKSSKKGERPKASLANTVVVTPPDWVTDDTALCMECSVELMDLKHSHICRICGCIFCPDCTTKVPNIPDCFKKKNKSGAVRCCFECRYVLYGGALLTDAEQVTEPVSILQKRRRLFAGSRDATPSPPPTVAAANGGALPGQPNSKRPSLANGGAASSSSSSSKRPSLSSLGKKSAASSAAHSRNSSLHSYLDESRVQVMHVPVSGNRKLIFSGDEAARRLKAQHERNSRLEVAAEDASASAASSRLKPAGLPFGALSSPQPIHPDKERLNSAAAFPRQESAPEAGAGQHNRNGTLSFADDWYDALHEGRKSDKSDKRPIADRAVTDPTALFEPSFSTSLPPPPIDAPARPDSPSASQHKVAAAGHQQDFQDYSSHLPASMRAPAAEHARNASRSFNAPPHDVYAQPTPASTRAASYSKDGNMVGSAPAPLAKQDSLAGPRSFAKQDSLVGFGGGASFPPRESRPVTGAFAKSLSKDSLVGGGGPSRSPSPELGRRSRRRKQATPLQRVHTAMNPSEARNYAAAYPQHSTELRATLEDHTYDVDPDVVSPSKSPSKVSSVKDGLHESPAWLLSRKKPLVDSDSHRGASMSVTDLAQREAEEALLACENPEGDAAYVPSPEADYSVEDPQSAYVDANGDYAPHLDPFANTGEFGYIVPDPSYYENQLALAERQRAELALAKDLLVSASGVESHDASPAAEPRGTTFKDHRTRSTSEIPDLDYVSRSHHQQHQQQHFSHSHAQKQQRNAVRAPVNAHGNAHVMYNTSAVPHKQGSHAHGQYHAVGSPAMSRD